MDYLSCFQTLQLQQGVRSVSQMSFTVKKLNKALWTQSQKLQLWPCLYTICPCFLTCTIAPGSEIFITDEFHVEEVDLRAVDAEAVPARDIVVQRTK